jgi:hypothetical protein
MKCVLLDASTGLVALCIKASRVAIGEEDRWRLASCDPPSLLS